MSESIVIICPDTNIQLWATRVLDAPIGGGKSAILQLAAAWARAGHQVTLAGAKVVEGEAKEGYSLRSLEHANGSYDVAIYVTGSMGHFRDAEIERIKSAIRVFWMNSPVQMSLPPGPIPDVFVAPARFLARRAIDEWDFPANRMVVIPGEATTRTAAETSHVNRDVRSVIYASHPHKGLDNAINLIERVHADYADVHLDVFGSIRLHGDHLEPQISVNYPDWVRLAGEVPQRAVEQLMPQYGLMLYLTSYIDGFSLATAEALTAGVVVIATAHGSNAEFIKHGWNGLLVSSGIGGQPDLVQAEDLLRQYFESPTSYQDMRERATASVPSWDDQAKDWERVWKQAL